MTSPPRTRPNERAPALRTLVHFAGRAEWSILALLLVAAGTLWGFVELADEVLEGSTREIDRAVLLALRSRSDPSEPLGPPWLEEMMRDFTALGGVGVLTLLTIAAIGYLILTGGRRAALAVAVAVAGGVLLSSLVKMGFDRPRPDLVPHGSYVYTASFPSGHSVMAAVVYLTLGALLARMRPKRRVKIYIIAVAILITILVGVSRVYLGVHWPTDVVGGWAVGSAWALLCWLATLWLQSRGEVESEEESPRLDRS